MSPNHQDGHGIRIVMFAPDVGELLGYIVENFFKEGIGLHHIRLVHAGNPLDAIVGSSLAPTGHLEGGPNDPLCSLPGNNQGIHCRLFPDPESAFTEGIKAFCVLPEDDIIDSFLLGLLQRGFNPFV
jgi:hypothetical protein